MVARRVDIKRFSADRWGKFVFTPLSVVRMLSARGDSLYWRPRPPHWPLDHVVGYNRGIGFANRYSNRPVKG